MVLRLTIACCLALISAAQDIPQSVTKEIAAAASEFVATLDESQQGKLIYDFRDEAQRKRHFPPGSPHAEDYAWAISRSGSEVLDRSDATDDDLRSRSRHGKQTA